ncbi:MAG: DUF3429 domain-containing protein [Ahrensia sp.]|nr:DUF3429 domain-containing protein [Ahrensia sp.]
MPTNAQNSQLLSDKLALSLALFGYVPFLALTLAVGPLNGILAGWASQFSLPFWFFAHVLTVYGAVILSFLGGIRWGVAMVGHGAQKMRQTELVLSVMPSLLGWAAVFMPRAEALYFLSACFIVQGIWDYRLTQSGRAPRWFKKLRILLTVLVSATLGVAGLWAG